jgi:hypothetical protein
MDSCNSNLMVTCTYDYGDGNTHLCADNSGTHESRKNGVRVAVGDIPLRAYPMAVFSALNNGTSVFATGNLIRTLIACCVYMV